MARPLLVEVGCEDIPAGLLGGLSAAIQSATWRELQAARLVAEGPEPPLADAYATPRRLVATVDAVRDRQPDLEDVVCGPPWKAAWRDGEWSEVAKRFAWKNGVAEPEMAGRLRKMVKGRGEYAALERTIQGWPAMMLLPEVVEKVLRAIPLPVKMNWDASIGGRKFPFVRRIQWIVALFGTEVVPFEIDLAGGKSVVAGNLSRGHRGFTRTTGERPGGPFPVASFAGLREGLWARGVILGRRERQVAFAAAVRECEAKEGGEVAAEARNDEVMADLVEHPTALVGRHSAEFLSLPEEIRRAVLVNHQRCLPFRGRASFLTVVDSPGGDPAKMRKGLENVVRARLKDADHLWRKALAVPLATRPVTATYHAGLGTYADKTARIEALAEALARRAGGTGDVARRAAGLAIRDEEIELAADFSELLGVLGGLILREQGADEAVWRAVYDSRLPKGTTGRTPASTEGAAVALALHADEVAGFFLLGVKPTASRDQHGLRRRTNAMLRLLGGRDWRTSPFALATQALDGYGRFFDAAARTRAAARLKTFVAGRMGAVMEAMLDVELPSGLRTRAARAVLAARTEAAGEAEFADLRLLAECLATGAAANRGGFRVLGLAAKRIRGVLAQARKRNIAIPPEIGALGADALPVEVAFGGQCAGAETAVARSLRERNYTEAVRGLASLAGPVERYFQDVLVMNDDPAVRARRLAQVGKLEGLFFRVGDLREFVDA